MAHRRARVIKRDGVWRWECRDTCPRGERGYPTRDIAAADLEKHLNQHNEFGFQTPTQPGW